MYDELSQNLTLVVGILHQAQRDNKRYRFITVLIRLLKSLQWFLH